MRRMEDGVCIVQSAERLVGRVWYIVEQLRQQHRHLAVRRLKFPSPLQVEREVWMEETHMK